MELWYLTVPLAFNTKTWIVPKSFFLADSTHFLRVFLIQTTNSIFGWVKDLKSFLFEKGNLVGLTPLNQMATMVQHIFSHHLSTTLITTLSYFDIVIFHTMILIAKKIFEEGVWLGWNAKEQAPDAAPFHHLFWPHPIIYIPHPLPPNWLLL